MSGDRDPGAHCDDGDPGARYWPADSGDAVAFMRRWCCNCARDLPSNSGARFEDCRPHELCPLLGNFQNSGNSPREWRYDRAGRAQCSAHVPKGQPAPPLNLDVLTRDLFAS